MELSDASVEHAEGEPMPGSQERFQSAVVEEQHEDKEVENTLGLDEEWGDKQGMEPEITVDPVATEFVAKLLHESILLGTEVTEVSRMGGTCGKLWRAADCNE